LARAEVVNRSRYYFLAGAGLSANQDRCIRTRNGLYLTDNCAQAAAAPYDRVQERGFLAFWLPRDSLVRTVEWSICRSAFRVPSKFYD
jgi:hypothetical protein